MIIENTPFYISRIALRFCLIKFLFMNSHSTANCISKSIGLDSEDDSNIILMINNELYHMVCHSLINSRWNDLKHSSEYFVPSKGTFDISSGISEFNKTCPVSYEIVFNIDLNDFMKRFYKFIKYGY